MKVFEITKKFPSGKKLTDQIRRSSPVACLVNGLGNRKQYPKHFSSNMIDADLGNTETHLSIDFAGNSKYISQEVYRGLLYNSEEIGRMLNHMIENPE